MITNPEIESYLHQLLPPRDEVLTEMETYAAQHNVPIIGPGVARVLAQLVMLSGAKRIFELGSAIGYSTIWLARAAGPGAEIHYSDGDPAKADRARGYFERAGVADRIQIHVGDALGALASVPGDFDVIFNDVDKDGYPEVLDGAPARLRAGGLFLTDNTLWSAKVLHPEDATTAAIVEFNRRLYSRDDFFTTTIPMRDGVSIAIKKSP